MSTLTGSWIQQPTRLHERSAKPGPAEKRMREFLAEAAHELRTPLTVIRGSTQFLLQRDRLKPQEVDMLLMGIEEEAARLSRLVDNLLHLGKLSAGQPLSPRSVTLSTFLDAFGERYATAWSERSIEIDGAALNGAQAFVDPEALTRVLINLVDNAARYSTPGTPILLTGEKAGTGVTILVRDEGPGLEPEIAERLFERFYQGNTSRDRRGGCGLGLAIVRALVEQSRGHIHIDTGPDRGTAVVVTLPVSSSSQPPVLEQPEEL